MILIGTTRLADETRHHRALPNGFSFHRSEWMDGGRDPHRSPTVFLVEQPPGSVLPTHFHTQNQFQVVKGGGGTLGPHPVGPGSVHYAGAYTGYGPLVAGPDGLAYFTIRAGYETGANFLPDQRDKLRRGPKRHAQGPVHLPATEERLRSLAEPVQTPLLAPADDGLAAIAMALPPQVPVPLPAATGSGQFQIVLAGEFVTPEQRLHAWESRYVSPDAVPWPTRSGPAGLHLLVLQMPAPAPAYAAAP